MTAAGPRCGSSEDARVPPLFATGEALELAAALWIELSHLPGKMAQRHVAVLLDERIDPGLRPEVGVRRA